MERVLSCDEKVRRAEEIYHRRKMGTSGSRFSKIDGEKKSYLGSKILLEVLLIINLSLIIVAVQNREYIFTKAFLSDAEKYNVNITETIKEFIGIDSAVEDVKEPEENSDNSRSEETKEETVQKDGESILENTQESIQGLVPNEEEQVISSLNQMDDSISKIKKLVDIERPIREGTVTSRFGTRESKNKNVTGYHTGIDIGAVKRHFNLFGYFAAKLHLYQALGSYREACNSRK